MTVEVKRKLKIFLAHTSQDKAIVREVFNLLEIDGFQCWFDEVCLFPGHDWKYEIEKAVQETDVVTIFLNEKSIDSTGYLHKEILLSIDVAERQPEGTIFIIPIRIENCEVPQRLKHLHWVDFILKDFSIGYAYLKLQTALIRRAIQLGLISKEQCS